MFKPLQAGMNFEGWLTTINACTHCWWKFAAAVLKFGLLLRPLAEGKKQTNNKNKQNTKKTGFAATTILPQPCIPLILQLELHTACWWPQKNLALLPVTTTHASSLWSTPSFALPQIHSHCCPFVSGCPQIKLFHC